MMRGWMLIGLLVASPLALAADGSWSSSSFGGVMTRGQQLLRSRPIQPQTPPPAGAVARTLAWKITPDRPTPAGFSSKICADGRCLALAGLSGELKLPAGFPAGGPWRFEYYASVRGVLAPPLTILSNELTLGFKGRE